MSFNCFLPRRLLTRGLLSPGLNEAKLGADDAEVVRDKFLVTLRLLPLPARLVLAADDARLVPDLDLLLALALPLATDPRPIDDDDLTSLMLLLPLAVCFFCFVASRLAGSLVIDLGRKRGLLCTSMLELDDVVEPVVELAGELDRGAVPEERVFGPISAALVFLLDVALFACATFWELADFLAIVFSSPLLLATGVALDDCDAGDAAGDSAGVTAVDAAGVAAGELSLVVAGELVEAVLEPFEK